MYGDEPCRGVWDDDDYEPSEPPDFSDFTCGTCGDTGTIEQHHPSFDHVIGGGPCPNLDDPIKHPPSTPVPLNLELVLPGHMPGCDGDCNFGYPDGCPPF